MGTTPLSEVVRTMRDVVDRQFTYGPARSRLLIRVVRTLAEGTPITRAQVDSFAAELGLPSDDADAFLRTVTERDAGDSVVGAVPGLSLHDARHRFVVDGTRLSTWCALDTLHLPAILERAATVESPSPVSGQTVRLRVSPRGVAEIQPADAVISIVVIDPDTADFPSVEAIWGTLCHHIFFFLSRQEAEQWADGRTGIEILSIDEGYEVARLFAAALLTSADQRRELQRGNAR